MTGAGRRVGILLLVGIVTAMVSWGTLHAVAERSRRLAGEAVTAQLAGDLQAAFDPATLRPASNPTGAEYLVLRDGALVTTSDLPLGVRTGDLLVDGTPVPVEGYDLTTRGAADAAGVQYLLVALVPTAGQPGGPALLAGIVLPVLLVAALSSARRPGDAPG